MNIPIHCKYDALVSVKSLKPHPKNRNNHPADQITRLAKIIEYQGVRAPIVVSKLSGFIVKGHGTLLAEIEAGMKEVPVVYQDFENEDQEYLFLQSDNAIASWAELDFSGINFDLPDLGPIDINLLGIRDFNVDPWESDIDAVGKVKENLDGIKATVKVLCPQEIKDEVLIYLKAKFLEVSFEGVEIV
jgi:hypothetical protein